MRVVGIDPSLTSLGIAYVNADGRMNAFAIKSKQRGMTRLLQIEEQVQEYLVGLKPELVVYEGYALGFRGKSNTIFDLGELGGILKRLILAQGIDILLTPPTSLKMFVTGKGNADKDAVAKIVRQETGQVFKTSDQNDAAGLVMMGEAYLNKRLLPRDRRHYKHRALKGCELISGF
jgi:Holliday junction resolvasome RuvABC endonuclease subunit